MEIIQTGFGFSGVEKCITSIEEEENDIELYDKCIMEVLCETCALRITNKYLNMLIACKLGEMNSAFKDITRCKRKSKKSEKSKKLNIVTFSKLVISSENSYKDFKLEKKQLSTKVICFLLRQIGAIT